MKKLQLCIICYFLPYLLGVEALRCNTGNQDDNDQYYKVMENCQRRNMRRQDGNDRNSPSSDSNESSSSNEDSFDRRSMSTGRFNGNGNDNFKNGMSNNNRNQMDRRSRDGNERNWYSDYFNRSASGMSGRDGGNSDSGNNHQRSRGRNTGDNNSRFRGSNSYDQRYNNDNQQDQSCSAQCFFAEFNLVDRRGFPERMAVVEILSNSIEDQELQNFLEEAVIQCFHYLNSDERLDKCQFSQGLLSCLIDKGRERCDDWNSQYY